MLRGYVCPEPLEVGVSFPVEGILPRKGNSGRDLSGSSKGRNAAPSFSSSNRSSAAELVCGLLFHRPCLLMLNSQVYGEAGPHKTFIEVFDLNLFNLNFYERLPTNKPLLKLVFLNKTVLLIMTNLKHILEKRVSLWNPHHQMLEVLLLCLSAETNCSQLRLQIEYFKWANLTLPTKHLLPTLWQELFACCFPKKCLNVTPILHVMLAVSFSNTLIGNIWNISMEIIGWKNLHCNTCVQKKPQNNPTKPPNKQQNTGFLFYKTSNVLTRLHTDSIKSTLELGGAAYSSCCWSWSRFPHFPWGR